MPAIEDDYLDVLQNIEATIIGVYRQHPDLLDSEVEKALNTVLLEYQAEKQQRAPHSPAPGALPEIVHVRLKQICEWHLGRATLESSEGAQVLDQMPPLALDEMIACLKRIRKSVQKWNREGGQRGYLHFVAEYLP